MPADVHGVSHLWEAVNRGKRAITLDIASAEGKDILMRLVDDHTLRRDIKALGKRIGLNNVTPYVMRHTVTSILSENDGVPPEQLADLLGHGGTIMMMRHYRHRLTRQVNVATALGSRLATGSTP